MYEYHMVQVPPTIEVKMKGYAGNEAAFYLQTLANDHATNGWEFHRVDTIGVAIQPGCIAALLGAKRVMVEYYVVTFRRPRQ